MDPNHRSTLRLFSVQLAGVGGLPYADISFDKEFNILCGPNGVGKTTVLEAIAGAMSYHASSSIKRGASVESGEIDLNGEVKGDAVRAQVTVKEFDPLQQTSGASSAFSAHARFAMYLKSNRQFAYQRLTGLTADPEWNRNVDSERLISGVSPQDFKNWFVNRYLFSFAPDALNQTQRANFELAKRCFEILDPEIRFLNVRPNSFEVMVRSPTGDIYFEYLSSGYRSALAILFSIIKEVEFRFQGEPINAEDFDGVILIDEIELHLHPTWQSRIARILREVFPLAQFIVTTHSPHVIQTAKPNQVIPLRRVGYEVSKSMNADPEYGFQGWTIEEILSDVMDMKDVRSSIANDAFNAFGRAIDSEALDEAALERDALLRMLHPDNRARQMVEFQFGELKNLVDQENETNKPAR